MSSSCSVKNIYKHDLLAQFAKRLAAKIEVVDTLLFRSSLAILICQVYSTLAWLCVGVKIGFPLSYLAYLCFSDFFFQHQNGKAMII